MDKQKIEIADSSSAVGFNRKFVINFVERSLASLNVV